MPAAPASQCCSRPAMREPPAVAAVLKMPSLLHFPSVVADGTTLTLGFLFHHLTIAFFILKIAIWSRNTYLLTVSGQTNCDFLMGRSTQTSRNKSSSLNAMIHTLLNYISSKYDPPTPTRLGFGTCATWPIRISSAYLEIADFLVILAPNLTQMEWTVAVHNVHKGTNFLEDPIRYANFTPKRPRRKTAFCHNSPLSAVENK